MDEHRLLHANQALWQGLTIGQEISVVKLDPHGTEVARYPGEVVARGPENAWLALRATWTYKRIEIDGLVFEPGDELIEWFSPLLPFNAFAVLSPTGDLRGWYANVTYPAFLERADSSHPLTLVWHDLYLDLVGLAHGRLPSGRGRTGGSGLKTISLGRLHAEILEAAEELRPALASPDQIPFLRRPGAPRPS